MDGCRHGAQVLLSPPPSVSHNLAHIKCIVVTAKESLFQRSSLIAETTSYVPSENILLMHLSTEWMIPELLLKLLMMAAAVAHVNVPPSHGDTHTVSTPSPRPYFSSCFSLLTSSVNVHFDVNVNQFHTVTVTRLVWIVTLLIKVCREAEMLRSMYLNKSQPFFMLFFM